MIYITVDVKLLIYWYIMYFDQENKSNKNIKTQPQLAN